MSKNLSLFKQNFKTGLWLLPKQLKLSTINNKIEALDKIKENSNNINYINSELLKDKEILLLVIKTLSKTVDKSFVNQKSFDDYFKDYKRKDIPLFDDPQFMQEALSLTGYVLKYTTSDLKDNFNLVLQAVKNYPNALFFASKELRNNKQIVEPAIERCGWSIRYASVKLQDNFELARKAILQNFIAFNDISSRLKLDKLIILTVISKNYEWMVGNSKKAQQIGICIAALSHKDEKKYSTVEMAATNLLEYYLAQKERNDLSKIETPQESKKINIL